MKVKSAETMKKECAFEIYRACGGNIARTLRELALKGEKITRPALREWIDECITNERAVKRDENPEEAGGATGSAEDRLLADLNRQKIKYERYFASLVGDKMDNQAQYAYTNLIRTMLGIRAKKGVDRAGLFTEFLRELIVFLNKEDPASVKAIEKNFDAFAAFAREKYAPGS